LAISAATQLSKIAPRRGWLLNCSTLRMPSSQHARPLSWKCSLGILTSRLRRLPLHAGSRNAMKLASRIDSQAFAVGCETPASAARLE